MKPKAVWLVGSAAAAVSGLTPAVRISAPSPVTTCEVRGRRFLVKRDDEWRLGGDLGAGISGNKARKLLRFALEGPRCGVVASMGGHQSNAMVAMAALCRARGVRFVYLAKPVPRWLRKTPSGNFARGLALGLELVPLNAETYRRCANDAAFRDDLLRDVVDGLDDVVQRNVTWLPQGGAAAGAEYGLRGLADEILEIGRPVNVVLPAGTGTTALFLARHLDKSPCRVFAVPCATDARVLKRDMRLLDAETGSLGVFPHILDRPLPPTEPKFRFGTPSLREWNLWSELRRAGLFLDLIYAPHTWDVLLRSLEAEEESLLDDDSDILYLHCGGVEGVATQLTRYRREGFRLEEDDILYNDLADTAS